MLQRIEHPNGIVTYRSPLLADARIIHAFTTRIGGVSSPPYDALNLGPLAKNADDDGNTRVAENFRRLREALALPKHLRVECRQVHGRAVWSPPPTPVKPADSPKADAMVTGHANLMLIIRTADCVPILITDRTGRHVAAVHAGWRGLVAGVIEATIEQLTTAHHVKPNDLIAAIGPAIGADHFEVGEEVAHQFAAANLDPAIDRNRGVKPHIDLQMAATMKLAAAGVAADHVDRADRCTFRDADEFFSHRRDQGMTGRMAAVIAVRGD